MRYLRNARRMIVQSVVSGADGRSVFTFTPPFETVPDVSARLMFAAAAGCSLYFVGEPTKSGCTVEVRKPKALVLGLVGVAHEVAPGVTVRIRAEEV